MSDEHTPKYKAENIIARHQAGYQAYARLGGHSFNAYKDGRRDEAEAVREGITDENREVIETVDVARELSWTGDEIVAYLPSIFTCEWDRTARLKLMWAIWRSGRRGRWSAEARFEKRDLWVGLFWDRRPDGLHLFIVPIPGMLLHLRRRG